MKLALAIVAAASLFGITMLFALGLCRAAKRGDEMVEGLREEQPPRVAPGN